MSSYYRVCTSLKDKGILVKEGHNLEQYKNSEAYVSAFKYNEEQKKLFDKNNSVAGMSDVTTDIIYFDLDNTDIEQARKDTVEVVDRLKKYGVEGPSVCISGGKGFHIAVHTDKEFTPKEARTLAVNLAGDLSSFDSSIYNANRIIRIEGSVHNKTGLRKTRILEDELRSSKISELKEVAKGEYEYEKPSKQKLSGDFLKLAVPVTKETKKDSVTLTDSVDYLSNPYKLQPWKLALSQGFFPEGTRSNALMILASTLKNKDLLKQQCYYALKAAADLQADRYEQDRFSKEEIWDNIIEQVYSPTWQGGSYSEDNFPTNLQNYFEDLGIPRKEYSEVVQSVAKLEDVFDDFGQYAASINENTIETGIKELDNALKIRKGHLIGLIAPPSVGKTSFALTVLNNTSKRNIPSFMGSYDMYKNNVIAKLIQRESVDNEDAIYQAFIDKDQEKIENYRKILKDNYGNVSFCFKSGQSIPDLKKSITMEEERIGEEIPLIVVDYLELISTDKTDPTLASSEAIQGLREIANDGKVVIVLLQPNKMSSKMNQPMLSYNAAKGSSSIAQACTAIMGCWREGMSPDNPENDNYFSINILKNRNGSLASLDFAWEGKTQKISSLTDEQRFVLKNLRDTKADADDDI